jgi:hypothetical protein
MWLPLGFKGSIQWTAIEKHRRGVKKNILLLFDYYYCPLFEIYMIYTTLRHFAVPHHTA